jgi:hypothetical protein
MRSLLPLARWALAIAGAMLAGTVAASGAIDYRFLPVPKPAATAKPPAKWNRMYGDNIGWLSPIRWRYNHSNVPAAFANDVEGTIAQIRSALDNWTQVCGVTYQYEGQTTIAPDTRINDPQLGQQPDYVNVVGWGDLNPIGPDTAGIAYVWHDDWTRQLLDTDIVLSLHHVQSTTELQRTATHEWGHALGLAHSEVPGSLMSGPPFGFYNSLTTLQRDDIRGCRCMYGGSTINPSGFSCSLPTRIDFGVVPVGGASAARTVTMRNHGNAPLTIHGVGINSLRVTRDDGCPMASILPPGESCSISVIARPTMVFAYTDMLTVSTSDGPYRIELAYAGTDGPVATPPVVQLVEYFHAAFGHYFVTHIVDEIAKLDDGTFAGWTRTGRTINAWTTPGPNTAAVCRFFSAAFTPKSSHFYTSFASECELVKRDASWLFEGQVFHVGVPDAQGGCAAGTQRVFRLYNKGQSGAPNHRFTTDAALRTLMIALGWQPEGTGDGVTMCAPS